ncbi:MAG TPA: acyl-CoA dehydrogenase family protein [Myxococcota bacterium]|nr:acyl-CoA dehydrogenase family protein [Myxococcota bacterium]
MNFAFTGEQEELRAAARAFLAEASSSERVRAAMASEIGYDAEIWKRIGRELGWPAAIVPEECGGLGLGMVELVALLEAMGEALLCAPFFATVCLAAQAVLAAGTDEQRRRWLAPIAEGEARAALATAEPGLPHDAVALEARREGDAYRLDGVKRYAIDGASADWLVVSARTPGSRGGDGVTLFVVPDDAAGLTRIALPTMDQTRRQAELRFAGVYVPAEARLGDEGAGAEPLRRALDLGAIALAAESVGGAQRCLDLSVAYAKQREQFGRPIGSFQAIKHKCADMMVRVETARSAAYYAACAAAEEAADLRVAASLAKAYCSEAYYHCAAETIQIFGGVGFTWEYDPHLYFKRARASEALLGTPAWHRERVARAIGL